MNKLATEGRTFRQRLQSISEAIGVCSLAVVPSDLKILEIAACG